MPGHFDEEPEKFHLTWKDCSREFLRSTTTHGLRRVGWSRELGAKLLWAALFLVAVVAYVAMMILLLLDYLEYPTRTIVRKEMGFQPFPGVTICNLNPIRNSYIGYPNRMNEPIPTDTFYKYSIASKHNGTKFGTIDPYVNDRTFFAKQVALLNQFGDRIPYGHVRSEFILHCSFDGRECDVDKDFIRVWSDVYGDCYTFGGGKAVEYADQRRLSKVPGPLNGLQLILNTQPEEHLHSMSESKGARLLVHPSEDMPFPEEGGLSVPTGFETVINMDMEVHHHLGKPYGNCMPRDVNKYGYRYSSVACHKVCIQEAILQSCLCGDPTLPIADGQNICSLNDMYSIEYECAEKVKEKMKQGDTVCDCPVPCREEKYVTDFSLAAWPSPRHEAYLDDMMRPIAEKTYTKADLAAVKVFYKEVGSNVFQEEATFELADYLTYMGGLSSLFIGISLLSIVEFIEYVYTMATLPCMDYAEWAPDVAVRKAREAREEALRPATAASRPHTAATLKEVKPRVSTPDCTLNNRPMPPRLSDNVKIIAS